MCLVSVAIPEHARAPPSQVGLIDSRNARPPHVTGRYHSTLAERAEPETGEGASIARESPLNALPPPVAIVPRTRTSRRFHPPSPLPPLSARANQSSGTPTVASRIQPSGTLPTARRRINGGDRPDSGPPGHPLRHSRPPTRQLCLEAGTQPIQPGPAPCGILAPSCLANTDARSAPGGSHPPAVAAGGPVCHDSAPSKSWHRPRMNGRTKLAP